MCFFSDRDSYTCFCDIMAKPPVPFLRPRPNYVQYVPRCRYRRYRQWRYDMESISFAFKHSWHTKTKPDVDIDTISMFALYIYDIQNIRRHENQRWPRDKDKNWTYKHTITIWPVWIIKIMKKKILCILIWYMYYKFNWCLLKYIFTWSLW